MKPRSAGHKYTITRGCSLQYIQSHTNWKRIVADAWKEWTQRSFVLRAPNEGQFTLCVRLAPAEVCRVMPPVHHAGGARTIDSMPVAGPSPAHAMLFS